MILLIDIPRIIANVGWISISLIVFFILYRIFLKRLNSNNDSVNYFLTLHEIDKDPASGNVQIFFEIQTPMEVEISVFSSSDNEKKIILTSNNFEVGGNIIQWNTKELENGLYFYQAKTPHQTVRKLVEVYN